MKISAVIIAFNEESKIAEAIRSVEWADEILFVDSESTDGTREIAASLGARVLVHKWQGFSVQKQFATDRAENDWIFSLDADERVSDELIKEIADIRQLSRAMDGYRIPRLSTYMGREIRHGGWYPDWQLRFFDRRKAHWKAVAIHESVELVDDSRVGKLSGNLLHFSIDSAEQHAEMIQMRYAPLSAEAMHARGTITSPLKIAFAGPISFLTTYVFKAGFLDGLPGLCIAYFGAYNVFLKHLLLWQLQNKKN